MSEDLFDELLSDVDDSLRFLAMLGEGLPDAELRLAPPGGAWLPAGAPPLAQAEQMLQRAEENRKGAALVEETATGICCALPVPRFAATLLAILPVRLRELFRLPDGLLAWLSARVEAALAAVDQEGLRVKNDQLTREVEVLTRHHHQLMEDNHRQFLRTQEREQEYARVLEKEVASRTAELRRTNAQLIEAAEAKDTFLATMSHELRTPMNSIIGLSSLALTLDLSAKARDYVQTVNASAQALLRILNDVLDFSKIEAGKLTLETIEFQPAAVLEEQVKLIAPAAAAKGLDLFTVIAPSIPATLLGDPLRLGQVLANLLNNALKFTETGGIILRARCLELRPTLAVLAFSVTDTGIGIEPDKIPSLFQSFTQADGSTTRRYGGTGLGLAICSRIVRLLGGEISAQGSPGTGCIFRFTAEFGLVTGADRASPPLPLLPAESSCMVVAESEVARTALSEMLSLLGLRVRACRPGAEQEGAAGSPPPDLILRDCGVGPEGKISASPLPFPPAYPGIPVIALTSGETTPENAAPGITFLSRDFRLAELAHTLARLLARDDRGEGGPLSSACAPSGEQATLILADPDAMRREFLASILASLGHAVIVTGSADEVRQALGCPGARVLILDPLVFGAPADAAIDALLDIPLPCILLTRRGETPPPRLAALAAAILTLPVNPQELFAAVDRLLAAPDDAGETPPPASPVAPAVEYVAPLPAGAAALLEEFDLLLAAHDLEAEALLQEVKALLASDDSRHLIDLEKQMRDYDFKAARESLRRLATSLGFSNAEAPPGA